MSCEADANAISQNTASVIWNARSPGSVSATPASAAPMKNCSTVTHARLVPNSSASGDHSGFSTQGRYSQLV